ncbi:MAG: AraC family transcriptional regulator [Spirochaeta sp.]
MNIITMRPGGILGKYVYWFACYDDFSASDLGFRMISEGTVDILIPLEGYADITAGGSKKSAATVAEPLLIGPQQSYSIYDTSGCSRAFGIVFRTGGAARFLGPQIGEFTNAMLPAREVLGSRFRVLQEQLFEAPSADRMFELAAAYLRRRIALDLTYAAEIEYAISAIQRGDIGNVSLVDFAENTIGFSHKHFVELFRRYTGFTPKRYQQIIHFTRLLEHCRHYPRTTWRQLALMFGYFDPSHLTKDFHRFIGMTPGEYLEAGWSHRQVLNEAAV